MKGKSFNLMIAHCVVFQRKPAVRKHKLRVIFLSALNSPWGINNHDIKFSYFFGEEIPVKVTNITIYVGISWVLRPFFIDRFGSISEFFSMLVEIRVGDGKSEVGIRIVGVGVIVGDFVDSFGPRSQILEFLRFLFFGRS